MRVSILIVGVVALLASAVEIHGCGDKFLSVGRGGRFQRGYVSLRPVSIAVLRGGASAQKAFLSRLKLAGHRIELIDDVAQLKARVAASKFDVVLADYEKAPSVSLSLQNLAAKPLFLPVVGAGSPHAAAAHREYGCLLRDGGASKQRNFLVILDQAVESNRKAKPVQCDLTSL